LSLHRPDKRGKQKEIFKNFHEAERSLFVGESFHALQQKYNIRGTRTNEKPVALSEWSEK